MRHNTCGLVNPPLYAQAAARYRPGKIDLLWIAESPPPIRVGAKRRYFYFEEMTERDSLFREVMQPMFPGCRVPSKGGSKVPLLRDFRAVGAFLIDLCKEPPTRTGRVNWPPVYEKWWALVKDEIADYNPRRIIAVKASVCRFVYARLDAMGLGDCLLTRKIVPFPAWGWQKEFHRRVAPLLAAAPHGRTAADAARQGHGRGRA